MPLKRFVNFVRRKANAPTQNEALLKETITSLQAMISDLQPTRIPAPGGHLLDHYFCEFDARALLKKFAKLGRSAKPGYITNYLGVEISPKVYPPVLEKMVGSLEAIPNPGNWHADIAEWAAALRSVALAKDSYRIVELGCGWGCWMTNMGAAARSLGLKVELLGVEGDAGHLINARETLTHNGFTDDHFKLFHGVAAPKAGNAIFPAPELGSAHWGGAPEFYPSAERLQAAKLDPSLQILDCYTLEQMSSGKPIDLLHIDIQGGEVSYVKGNMESISKLVKRVLIGTHSREIDGQLFTHFQSLGWKLEMERPTFAPPVNGVSQVRIDGVQCWLNPKFENI